MFQITDPKLAKALCQVQTLSYLLAFIGEEKSVTQVAEQWKIQPSAAYYRVLKLEKMGFIRVITHKKRAGKDQKYYQAISDSFFIPMGIVPEASLEVFLAHTNQHHGKVMLKAQEKAMYEFLSGSGHQWGIQIGRQNEHGQKFISLSDHTGQIPNFEDTLFPMVISSWSTLTLDYPDAQQFRQEMLALLNKFSIKKGANKYLIHFALAPIE